MNTHPELNVAALRKNLATGFHRLRFGPISVPVRYHRGSNDTLIVIFHGAVDQSKREIPRYQSLLPGLNDCHQLSIADPTLELHPAIGAGWYIGGASMPLQATLPGLLKSLFKLSGAKQRVYLGGSSGGFAALYYSFLDPGSVCIAVNPQTDLKSYSPKATEIYRQRAWPDARSMDEIAKDVVIDLPIAYCNGFENMVIYLQSSGDLRHFGAQMPEFCKVGLARPRQFILNCGYWGVPGHSNSVPSKDYYPWVKAVVAAPWFDRQAILDTHHALTVVSGPTIKRPTAADSGVVQPQDLNLAALLRDYHLRQTTEG